MKNQQTIVNNRKSQLRRSQYALKIVAARSFAPDAPDCSATSLRPATVSWCSHHHESSILVQALTKLLQINLFIVDNFAHRYDSCSLIRDIHDSLDIRILLSH